MIILRYAGDLSENVTVKKIVNMGMNGHGGKKTNL
jgi:hypothetical protein